MKIRCITFGLHVEPSDFLVAANLTEKFDKIQTVIQKLSGALCALSHEIQTTRVSLNSFEKWLIPLMKIHNWSIADIVSILESQLKRVSILYCSIGNCDNADAMSLLPDILKECPYLHGSVLFNKQRESDFAPDFTLCQQAAKASLDIFEKCGELGNFRFCSSFNCKPGTPFFPTSYHEGERSSVSIGLENGDLLFLAFHGVQSHVNGRDNLTSILRQVCLPIQTVAQSICDEFDILYGGIDASINPGLSIPDSVGLGLENLIFPIEKTHFGSMGTLAAVSTVTSAVKALAQEKNGIKLVGYNGLMLPVMEDLRLAELAISSTCNSLTNIPVHYHISNSNSANTSLHNNDKPAYTIRDLLTFSSVCGVGLDTVPIPGNTTVDELAGVYMEVGSMAFRLNKPLSCRLMPMKGKVAGDMTDIDYGLLCNTKVFSLNM